MTPGSQHPLRCETCKAVGCNDRTNTTVDFISDIRRQNIIEDFISRHGCASHTDASHPAASEQEIRADERKKVLDELNVWRLKRMNGMLKKDVWIGWNEETDLIEQLRRQPPSQQGWGEA